MGGKNLRRTPFYFVNYKMFKVVRRPNWSHKLRFQFLILQVQRFLIFLSDVNLLQFELMKQIKFNSSVLHKSPHHQLTHHNIIQSTSKFMLFLIELEFYIHGYGACQYKVNVISCHKHFQSTSCTEIKI